ncbi:MAG: class II fructose-bisphosphate aldolase [Spirochaetota bacterium]
MNFLPSIELIRDAELRGYAVPSFCAWNAEAMKTILDVAEELRAPVIVMNGWAEFPIIRPKIISSYAWALIKHYTIPASLHLDHGQSIEEVVECIEANYTSVMLDFSTRPFKENASALRAVVEIAHPRGVTVEGELGAVGRAEEETAEGTIQSSLTEPEEARKYVKETAVDILAVSIGNAHGIYRVLPRLDFDRLKKIHDASGIPLVLHGGSGTPQVDLKRAISLGIAKVNVASELVHTVRNSLMEQWQAGKNLWISLACEPAYRLMADVVRKWFYMTGSAGKA